MSDISGYRSDGGGLGQDQGLSKQLRGILTAKLPLLSAPGTVLENSLYYDINSSSVTAVEEQATFAKDRIVLNNFTMGSTPSAYIPSVLFANTVFWMPVFKDYDIPAGTTNLNDRKMNIPIGWGFAALQNIIVYMGASSIAQIQISGITNMHVNLATCETFAKRSKMLEGAGRYLNPHDAHSRMGAFNAGYSMWSIKAYGPFVNPNQTNYTFGAPFLRQAVVPLRLPWSSMAILDKRLSMDCKLSTQPIQITLQTRALQEFCDVDATVATWLTNSWDSSTIQLWQEELSDKSLSVRNELLAMPEFNVGYPFQYAQSIPFEITTTLPNLAYDNLDASTKITMNITSIINSDLTTFLFSVTWSGRSQTVPSSGQFCPCYSEELLNIELLLNGQRFFFFDNDAYQFVTLAKQLDTVNYECPIPILNVNQNIGPNAYGGRAALATPYIYEFNNSRLRSIIAESHLQNTARFTNQTFQLRFHINRTSFYLGTVASSQPATLYAYNPGINPVNGYTLNMTYLYNAVYLVGGDGGTTKLITN